MRQYMHKILQMCKFGPQKAKYAMYAQIYGAHIPPCPKFMKIKIQMFQNSGFPPACKHKTKVWHRTVSSTLVPGVPAWQLLLVWQKYYKKYNNKPKKDPQSGFLSQRLSNSSIWPSHTGIIVHHIHENQGSELARNFRNQANVKLIGTETQRNQKRLKGLFIF